MKWGTYNLRWARPLKNILCLYDNKKLSFRFGHLLSNDKTINCPLLSEKYYKVSSIKNYFRLLDKFQVIISQQDRINKILLDGEKICNKRKLSIKKDLKLLHEVSNLVEKPYLLLLILFTIHTVCWQLARSQKMPCIFSTKKSKIQKIKLHFV